MRPILMTTEEAAKALSISRKQVYKLMDTGLLGRMYLGDGEKGGPRSLVRVKTAEVDMLVEIASGKSVFDQEVIDEMKRLRGEPLEESSSSSPSEVSVSEGR